MDVLRREFLIVLIVVSLAVLIGVWLHDVLLCTLIGVTGYTLWQVYQAMVFRWWMRHGRADCPPILSPLWQEFARRLIQTRTRYQVRHTRLMERFERFRGPAEVLPDAIVVHSVDGIIQWYNRAACHLLGLHVSGDIGQRLLNFIRHPDFAQSLSQSESNGRRKFLPSPVDTQTILEVQVLPYGKEHRLLIARDVTHLQRLEEIRRDFVANVSHEMRTPLTVLKGYLEALQCDAEGDEHRWTPIFDTMEQQTKRMESLVSDLLLLARLESSKSLALQTPVNVSLLLARVQDEAVALSGEQRHVLTFEVNDTLWMKGDPHELHSAISNLVSNAIRYTPGGGTITVRWDMNREHGGADLAVSDSGIGIELAHIPRLTERFYRVDVARSRHTGGTGLGLAIVKHVMQRHEAVLRIDSIVDHGSTFCCQFPRERIMYDAEPSPLSQKVHQPVIELS